MTFTKNIKTMMLTELNVIKESFIVFFSFFFFQIKNGIQQLTPE